jgi:transcriptional regulator with XRE-family HTH domain
MSLKPQIDSIMWITGAALRAARKQAGLIQDDVAKKLVCSHGKIGDLEHAERIYFLPQSSQIMDGDDLDILLRIFD